MRKALTALALAGAAMAAPMVSTGTAYADTQPVTVPVGAIVTSAIDSVALPGGCTLTYVAAVEHQPIGPVLVTPPGAIVINYAAAETYIFAQTSNTLWYVRCI